MTGKQPSQTWGGASVGQRRMPRRVSSVRRERLGRCNWAGASKARANKRSGNRERKARARKGAASPRPKEPCAFVTHRPPRDGNPLSIFAVEFEAHHQRAELPYTPVLNDKKGRSDAFASPRPDDGLPSICHSLQRGRKYLQDTAYVCSTYINKLYTHISFSVCSLGLSLDPQSSHLKNAFPSHTPFVFRFFGVSRSAMSLSREQSRYRKAR